MSPTAFLACSAVHEGPGLRAADIQVQRHPRAISGEHAQQSNTEIAAACSNGPLIPAACGLFPSLQSCHMSGRRRRACSLVFECVVSTPRTGRHAGAQRPSATRRQHALLLNSSRSVFTHRDWAPRWCAPCQRNLLTALPSPQLIPAFSLTGAGRHPGAQRAGQLCVLGLLRGHEAGGGQVPGPARFSAAPR